MRERIFQPFTRATQRTPGSGMGLSIAKRICDRFGWKLELLDSEKGAHFKVTLITDRPILPMDRRAQL